MNGTCGNGINDQFVMIKWNVTSASNSMNMTFKLNQTTHEYALHELGFSLSKEILPNANQTEVLYHRVGSAFETHEDKSYHCTRGQLLNLTTISNSSDVVGTVSFSNTLLEAYHKGESKQYSTSIDCDAISTPGNISLNLFIRNK